MSFWIFANFFHKKLQQSEELRNSMAKIISNIETYEHLKTQLQVSSEEKFRLKLDIEMFDDLQELVEEDREQHERMSKELSGARDSFMELQRMLRRIDLKKLAYYDILINEMKRQQEWKEMEEVFKQKLENRQKMEKRNIVQELRRKQAELKEMETKAQQELQSVRAKYEDTKQRVEDSKNRRNQIVVSLVKGSKELENIRNEIQTISNQKQELQSLQNKRDELKKQLGELKVVEQGSTALPLVPTHHTRNEDNGVFKRPAQLDINDTNWKTSMMPPTIDPFNPMAFLQIMKIKFNMSSCFQEMFSTNQNENIPNKDGKEILPILKLDKRTQKRTQDLEEQPTTTRRVRFSEPEVNCSTSSSSSSPALSSDMDLETASNKNMKRPTDNDFKTDSSNESRTEVVSAALKMKSVGLLDSDIPTPLGVSLPENCATTNETTSKFDIEILDCQEVNSTGKDLTKAPTHLSDILSNPSTISGTYNISSTAHSIEQSGISQPSTTEIDPILLKKGFSNVENRDVSSAKEVKKLKDDFIKETNGKRSLAAPKKNPKRKHILDFDSMFRCNTSPPSEKEEDAGSNCFNQDMTTSGMLNFGQTDSLGSDEGDRDGEEMIFSDNEWLTKDTGAIEDFL